MSTTVRSSLTGAHCRRHSFMPMRDSAAGQAFPLLEGPTLEVL
jgi:hypothetical protein